MRTPHIQRISAFTTFAAMFGFGTYVVLREIGVFFLINGEYVGLQVIWFILGPFSYLPAVLVGAGARRAGAIWLTISAVVMVALGILLDRIMDDVAWPFTQEAFRTLLVPLLLSAAVLYFMPRSREGRQASTNPVST